MTTLFPTNSDIPRSDALPLIFNSSALSLDNLKTSSTMPSLTPSDLDSTSTINLTNVSPAKDFMIDWHKDTLKRQMTFTSHSWAGEEVEDYLDEQSTSNIKITEASSDVGQKNNAYYNKVIHRLILKDNMPVRMLQCTEFINLLSDIPNCEPPNLDEFVFHLFNAYELAISRLKNGFFSTACSFWKNELDIQCLSVTANFIDKDWKLVQMFVGMQMEDQSSICDSPLFKNLIKQRGLNVDKCLVNVNDSLETLHREFRALGENNYWVCADHLIKASLYEIFFFDLRTSQFSAQQHLALSTVDLLIAKCRLFSNTIQETNDFKSLLDMFQKVLEKSESTEISVNIDSHHMIKMEPEAEDQFSFVDVQLLKDLYDLLTLVFTTTADLSKSHTVTISLVLRTFSILIIKLRSAQHVDHLRTSNGKEVFAIVAESINKQLRDHLLENELLQMATCLDPRTKLASCGDNVDLIERVKKGLFRLYKMLEPRIVEEKLQTEVKFEMSTEDIFSCIYAKPDHTRQKVSTTSIKEFELELMHYLSLPNKGIDSDPLEFWKTYDNLFPKVSLVAQVLLATPATVINQQNAVEVFGNPVTSRETLLSEEANDMLYFLRINYKL
ncbi:hypothetical protein Ciccas_012979 [Cichlidogyrus casuarinus]|uniref:HAT C-terminal dimerisation domain-containing protein n=1 Tax=Cichlidogyrus casuarinus TaxID=1844966 RepID=A0ABD2PLX1_9PLAT